MQFLAKDNEVMVIECNLRASRSFPFVSKVLKINFIDLATRLIMGEILSPPDKSSFDLKYVGVKAPQFSFTRLHGSDPITRVEMKSTGEVGCLGDNLNEAFLTSLIAVGFNPEPKSVLLSTGSLEKKAGFIEEAETLQKMGVKIYATEGTADFLNENNIKAEILNWPLDRNEPNVLTYLAGNKIDLVINIPKNSERAELDNDYLIRRKAVDQNISLITNMEFARRFVKAVSKLKMSDLKIKSWDEYV